MNAIKYKITPNKITKLRFRILSKDIFHVFMTKPIFNP